MGSYEGSSDWDDVPAPESARVFKPEPRKPAEPPRPAAKRNSKRKREAAEPPLEVAKAERKRLNALFAFDTTGSMTPWFENVQEKIDYLAVGLLKLLDMEIQFLGVGDHGDGRGMLQIARPSSDLDELKVAVRTLRPTDGRDTPEAFECLFKVLNAARYDVPTVLILITDSIPHGMEGYAGDDDGCPFGVDYKHELAELRQKLKNVYLISCAPDAGMRALQKRLVGDNAFIELSDFRRLTNLVMAICMEEVGDLAFFMDVLERQRGKERRREVLELLGRD